MTVGGRVTTLAGTGVSGDSVDGVGAQAGFGWLTGGAVDKSGTVYLVDRSNNAIRVGRPVPVLLSSNRIATAVGKGVNVAMKFSPVATRFAASGLPAGLKLDATKGTITGKPTKAGTFLVKITATSPAGAGGAALLFKIASR